MTKHIKKLSSPIVISGGGLVGLTTAIALAQKGIPITIIDPAPMDIKTQPSFDGRALALSLSSSRLFQKIGVWNHMNEFASPIHDIRVADGHPLKGISPFFVHYDHKALGHEPFGYIVENRYIMSSLHETLKECPSISFIKGKITNFHATKTQTQVFYQENDTEKSISATLLIGADGKFSPTRKIAGINTINTIYKQKAIVCTVEHEYDHQGTAVELFLPNGPFAMLPMTHHRSNIVWSENPDVADFLTQGDESLFVRELQKRFGTWLGEFKVVGPRFTYPLSLSLAERYTDNRFILIGDAAHSIHPIAGQGFNMGIRDIAALEETLTPLYEAGIDFGQSTHLKQYEQWRYFDNKTLASICHALLFLFSNDNKTLRIARNAGFATVESMLPLKKIFMKHAMGILGDMPRLFKP